MIKVEVIEDFTLSTFNKVQNLHRGTGKDKDGYLYVHDTFECDKGLCEYLTGGNVLGKTVVKVIEVIPEKKEVKVEETISEELERKVKEQQVKLEKAEKPKRKNKK